MSQVSRAGGRAIKPRMEQVVVIGRDEQHGKQSSGQIVFGGLITSCSIRLELFAYDYVWFGHDEINVAICPPALYDVNSVGWKCCDKFQSSFFVAPSDGQSVSSKSDSQPITSIHLS